MVSIKYTIEFKKAAVALVTEKGYSREKAAQELGTSRKNISRWVKQFEGKQPEPEIDEILEQQEIRKLRRENARLKMEREILKKAAAFFASEKL